MKSQRRILLIIDHFDEPRVHSCHSARINDVAIQRPNFRGSRDTMQRRQEDVNVVELPSSDTLPKRRPSDIGRNVRLTRVVLTQSSIRNSMELETCTRYTNYYCRPERNLVISGDVRV